MINIKCFKEELMQEENITKVMFNILRDNMIDIIPETFGDYEKDSKIFLENCIKNAIEEYKVKTIVAFNGDKVVGYLQYFCDTESNELCIREIQISKEHQGDHETFHKLIKAMITDGEYEAINKVKGYINNKNEKSRNVFISIGFKVTYERKNGKIYNADKETLSRWFNEN